MFVRTVHEAYDTMIVPYIHIHKGGGFDPQLHVYIYTHCSLASYPILSHPILSS